MSERLWLLPYTEKTADNLMAKFGKLYGGGLYKRKIGRGPNKGLYYIYQKNDKNQGGCHE